MSAPNGRLKAWRNMLVAGLNAALAQGRITLDEDNEPDETPFDFTFAGLPARGRVHGMTYGELSITVVVNPKPTHLTLCAGEGDHLLRCLGDAYASGWLERRTGKYLQRTFGRPLFAIRNGIKPIIAA